MENKRFDQHIHTSLSYDAKPGNPHSLVIETAIAKCLAGIAITDHLDPLWPDENEPSVLDLPASESALTEAESDYAGRISFAKGIELGLMPGEALEICQNAVSGYPYDFVIGSVHCSPEAPVDAPPFLEGRELKDIIEEYYTLILDSIHEYKNYDVLGHLNCIDRYTEAYAPEEMYMPYADEILKIAVRDGKGLEYNTSTFRYNMGERGTPTLPILKRFKELGGEIVTLGSDAHVNTDIGSGIEKGEEVLLATGFRYIAVFMERRPSFIKIA